MRIVLLFVLLNSVCGDSDELDLGNGCLGGWFEFTCNYRNENNFQVTDPQNRPIRIQNIEDNTWTAVDQQRSVYRNTTGKYWRVFVTQLTRKDFGEYECKNYQIRAIDLTDDDPVCPQYPQIAYIGADTTIRCTHRGVNFICKQSSHACDILSRAPKPVYRISDVSRQDQGVYWCGYESRKGYKVSKKKIELQVVEVTRRSLSPGQDLTHQCNYTNLSIKKFVCKGESPTMCEELVSTSHRSNGRFTLEDVETNWMIILTIRNVAIEDRGSYWCGTENEIEKVFIHKLELTVANMTTPPSTTHLDVAKPSPHAESTSRPATFTSPTPPPTSTKASPYLLVIVASSVCVVVLVVVLVVLIIKGKRRNEALQQNNRQEERVYEDLQTPDRCEYGTLFNTREDDCTVHTAPSGDALYANVDTKK